jgi:hypothetical protein
MSQLNLTAYPAIEFDSRFRHPCSIFCSAPTQSGKSTLFYTLLQNGLKSFDTEFRKIYIVYGVYQAIFKTLKKTLPIVLIPLEDFNINMILTEDVENCFFLFDDAMLDVASSSSFSDLVTKYVHHKRISVGITSQYLFPKGRYSRIIATNSTYTILFSTCRDQLSINILARQMYGTKSAFFMQAFELATRLPHSALLVDCHQLTPQALRLRGNLWAPYQTVFLPVD